MMRRMLRMTIYYNGLDEEGSARYVLISEVGQDAIMVRGHGTDISIEAETRVEAMKEHIEKEIEEVMP